MKEVCCKKIFMRRYHLQTAKGKDTKHFVGKGQPDPAKVVDGAGQKMQPFHERGVQGYIHM